MGTVTERDTEQRQDQRLSTADLAAAATPREQADMRETPSRPEGMARPEAMARGDAEARREDEDLAALFPPDAASGFRSRWDAVQIAFVDDPAKAVRDADELVAQVMKSLAESFA